MNEEFVKCIYETTVEDGKNMYKELKKCIFRHYKANND